MSADTTQLVDEVRQLRRDVQQAFKDRGSLELLDVAKLARELGVTTHAAEAIFRELPKVNPPNLRKVYVRRRDVEAFLTDATKEG